GNPPLLYEFRGTDITAAPREATKPVEVARHADWVSQPTPLLPHQDLRYLGQIRASYLLCEDAQGIVFVDQHALHEKIRVEALKAEVQKGQVAFQRLLVPKVIPLSADKIALVETHQQTLHGLGFEVTP